MAAGTRRFETVVPIAGVTENILAGTPLEYPGVPSSLEIYCACILAALGEITMDVIIGTDLVAEGMAIGIETVAGEGPRVPQHQVLVDAIAPADHVQIRLRNAAAAATRQVYTLVRIQPV